MKPIKKDKLYYIKISLYKVATSLYFWALIFSVILDLRYNEKPDIIAIVKDGSLVSVVMYLFYIAFFVVMFYIIRFLTSTTKPIFNNEIINQVNELIDGASLKIYIITPYFNIGNVFIEKLLQANNDGVEIIIIHNTSENDKIEFQRIFNRLAPYGIKF